MWPGESGVPPLPPSDTGAAVPSDMKPPGYPQETITVTQGSLRETMTIGGSQPGETVVVTVGGDIQTVTVGPDYPQMTCEYIIWWKRRNQKLTALF